MLALHRQFRWKTATSTFLSFQPDTAILINLMKDKMRLTREVPQDQPIQNSQINKNERKRACLQTRLDNNMDACLVRKIHHCDV